MLFAYQSKILLQIFFRGWAEWKYECCLNLDNNIIERISSNLNLLFNEYYADVKESFTPLDLLDYIYAILHSPTYREKYKEFLKIDFPRVPYPKDTETFWQLVKLGEELRQLHLMESPVLNNLITQYPVVGGNQVEKITYADGKVFINPEQYFANVSKVAWEFYIGGYQPAQKWLKDRKAASQAFDLFYKIFSLHATSNWPFFLTKGIFPDVRSLNKSFKFSLSSTMVVPCVM